MNPFFWLLVLSAAVALWFALRHGFIWLGKKAADLAEDTMNILCQEDEQFDFEGDENNE